MKPQNANGTAGRDGGLDLNALRERLASLKGPEYWRSLEEIAETDEFKKLIEDEFPHRTANGVDRRNWLKLMGASLGLAGLTACTKQPTEQIVPYVKQPEDFIPGKPLFYATAFPMGGVAQGVLAESHLGRPTKIEGNPDHPGSLGSTDIFGQASILNLYDPDRAQVVTNLGEISSFGGFIGAAAKQLEAAKSNAGAGLRILTQNITSPSLIDQMQAFLKTYPSAKWHYWEPAGDFAAMAGAQLAFGRPVNTVYRIENADVIVSLDADFLFSMPGHVRYAREFANRRRLSAGPGHEGGKRPKADMQEGFQEGPDAPFKNQSADKAQRDQSKHAPMEQAAAHPEQLATNRLYVVESAPSITGGMADHRWRMKATGVEAWAGALAAALGVSGGQASAANSQVGTVAKDLLANKGKCVVIPGPFQSPAVHALAHGMNQALGNAGKTVFYTEPLGANPTNALESIKMLVSDMNAGSVDFLLVLGANPVYNAPADLNFAAAMEKVKFRAQLSMYEDETSAYCQWHIPETHYLEAWGDARAYDGTVTVMQPLIAPLYAGKSALEVMAVLTTGSDVGGHEIVKSYWQGNATSEAFQPQWQTVLHNGIVQNSAFPPLTVTAKAGGAPAEQQPSGGGLEIVFRPDPTIWDGTFSNNGWLQELGKHQTKHTWDNSVWLSAATAQRLGVRDGNNVELTYGGRKVTGPVSIVPGHADDCATVQFGYGRTRAGHTANGVGYNAYALRTSGAPWQSGGLEIRKAAGSHDFAIIQHTQTMEERRPVRFASLEEFKKNPEFASEEEEPSKNGLSLFPDYKYEGYKWGMAIDLNTCIGCSACTIACQAENNIAVVGREEVARGRHMHWIRVDRYYHGQLDDPELFFQPVPCMQCENAPCEVVCPVAATVHSGDGLNQMVYNRCVGTRYCSNNCPYKVRRFNFFRYSDWYTESLYGLRNPDVSVRSRGVMEKCTYCVQRINAAKIESEKENRRIRDGEVIPACAQACPTQAITFGDINDKNSNVAKLKSQPRNYGLLEDLNTRPRTTYLARLRNPNPDLEKG